MPALSVAAASGLVLVAIADSGARAGATWAEALFWSGVLTLYAPIAWRLIAPAAARGERIGLLALLALGLYAVKLLQNPLEFTFYDELQHWRTANDILSSGHLFQANPLLPVSPRFPGLENSTSAFVSLTGLSIFQAGVTIVGAARSVLILALFFLYERIGRSAHLASIAALLYMANPNFLFFDAQYGYESLALAYAALALYLLARRGGVLPAARIGLTGTSLLAIAALITTHHVTSYALVAVLLLWTAVDIVLRRTSGRPAMPAPGWIGPLTLVVCLGWLAFVAPVTIRYLSPEFGPALAQLLQFLTGHGAGRQLFRDFAGQRSPLWEQLIGYGAVAIILVALPFGWWRIWRRYRANVLALTMAIAALAYPATLALRLTPRGLEVANRSSEFLFAALGLVLAIIGHRLVAVRRWPPLALTAVATLVFTGGAILGWPLWARLPGPYLVSADMRSIEPEGVTAAEWTRRYLDPGNRVAADDMNRLLMGSLGEQDVELNGDRVPLVFFAPVFGNEQRAILQEFHVRYLVVDRRLGSGLPMVGIYIQEGEPDTLRHTTPFPAAALAKFDGALGVDRLFDSGDIAIYEVSNADATP